MNTDQKPKRPVFNDDDEGQYAEYLYLKGKGKTSAHEARTQARIKTLNDASRASIADYVQSWVKELDGGQLNPKEPRDYLPDHLRSQYRYDGVPPYRPSIR